MSDRKKLVMIGNGMAGVRAIEEILEANPDMFDITIFGAEAHPNYNRILLSHVLAGDMEVEDIILNDEQWYADNGITLHLGKRVREIQRGYKKVVAEDGTEAEYDKLIIATGSNPFMIPIPGADKQGIITFRNIEDCDVMFEAAKAHQTAVVIGGGLLGLEAAKGLVSLGMDVTVVHDQPTLMNMQLDETAGDLLRISLEEQGIKFRLSTLTAAILGMERATGLLFTDGSMLDCDLLVMAVGIRPNIELARKAGIYCKRGIVVNDHMQTLTDASICAVGECTEHRGVTYGTVAPLYEQARILANLITGQGLKSYGGSEVSTRLKITGVDVFSAGNFQSTPESDVIEYQDRAGGIYKKLVLEDNKITGAVMFGDTADGPIFFNMLQEGRDVSVRRSSLLFDQSHLGDSGHSGINHISAMTDDTIVCGCNGTTKKSIVKAITKEGCITRKEVTACTKAGGSCGGCVGLVEQLLASVLGTAFDASKQKESICGCTKLTHEEVKDEIRDQHLTGVHETMQALLWKGEGCHVCRPAINYYIGMIWPLEAVDDRFSRVVNEKMHANIQKDGSYSVIPRVFGGEADADYLIRMGEVAKKYNIKTIKITGGQRIGLYGVKKEDLVAVWRDLDMSSGFAYGKALRTVKTCVGSEWCRFGTQNSTAMGIRLEKIFDRSWYPAKTKLAASGCPRNCAEATIKDLGVVGVEGGWEIYVGGNGGVKVRACDLLCLVKTDDEVVEIAKAYLQHYRETGRHNERCAPWLERLGLDRVRQAVVEDIDSRQSLVERMDLYLSTLTADPWHERLKDEAQPGRMMQFNEYAPIEIQPQAVNA
jgi:nitrite reductase (NADH) large subunit